MTTTQDELCPDYVGAEYVVLNLSDPDATLQAFTPISIDATYVAAGDEGMCLPMVLTVVAPTASNFVRRVYRRIVPSSFSFTPREGGRHVIRLGEFAHNRWFGVLILDVAGDRASREA